MISLLLVVGCAVVVVSIAIFVNNVLHASDGYEDESGFHSVTPRKSRRKRAIEPTIEIKAGALQ